MEARSSALLYIVKCTVVPLGTDLYLTSSTVADSFSNTFASVISLSPSYHVFCTDNCVYSGSCRFVIVTLTVPSSSTFRQHSKHSMWHDHLHQSLLPEDSRTPPSPAPSLDTCDQSDTDHLRQRPCSGDHYN